MKAAPHIDYKALYTQSLGCIREQQNTIGLLHHDVTMCVQEQQHLKQEVASLQKVLRKKLYGGLRYFIAVPLTLRQTHTSDVPVFSLP